MTVKRAILIRPGETDWNQMGRWQGWAATPLNEHGRLQAERLANFVRNIGMSALYSSDLRRAKETAERIAARLAYAPIYDARLRERNIGAWQGLTLDEMKAWYPDEYRKLLDDVEGYQVPGGESRNQVRERMLAVFGDILAQEKGETVGIISHTTSFRALLSELIPDCNASDLMLGNSSVTTIARTDGERWQIVTCNDTMHLEGLESRSAKELEQSR